jgi:hypothetical protein
MFFELQLVAAAMAVMPHVTGEVSVASLDRGNHALSFQVPACGPINQWSHQSRYGYVRVALTPEYF